jgi:hypothetical protein
MSILGTVESLWRYPVKSMRGEELKELFAGANFTAGGHELFLRVGLGSRRLGFGESRASTTKLCKFIPLISSLITV